MASLAAALLAILLLPALALFALGLGGALLSLVVAVIGRLTQED